MDHDLGPNPLGIAFRCCWQASCSDIHAILDEAHVQKHSSIDGSIFTYQHGAPEQEVRKVQILHSKEVPFERRTCPMNTKQMFLFVKRLHESWTTIEGCLLRAQHVYRDQRTWSLIEDRALPLQGASYGDLRRLSKWHVYTFVGRHALGMQAAVCNQRSCQVIETPTQRLHEYLEPSVKVNKFDRKIPPETSKKAPLARNIPKQVKGTKQNRIFWLRPPLNMLKRASKGL